MFEVWETDGTYIEGNKVGEREKVADAKKLAKKIKDFHSLTKAIKNPAFYDNSTAYWVEDEEGMPIGLIKKV
jgi:hypothetical protein